MIKLVNPIYKLRPKALKITAINKLKDISYYITTDLKTSKVYIAQRPVNTNHPFLIEFDEIWKADQILKLLNFKNLSPPPENMKNFKFIRVIKEDLGEVYIYEYLVS